MNVQHSTVAPRAAGRLARGAMALAIIALATGHALAAEPLSVDAATAASTAPSAAWQAAEDAYDTQHFAAALAAFEQLAAQGDARAAERAGLMLFYGPRLYGNDVPQDAQRAAAWLAQAANGGSDVARLLLGRLPAPDRPPLASATSLAGEEPRDVPGPDGC